MKFKALIAMALVLAAFTIQCLGQSAGKFYAATSTDLGTNLSYIIAPVGSGIPIVRYVNATSDLTTSKVTFYTVGTNISYVTTNTVSGTNQIWVSGTGFFNTNDVVVIRCQGPEMCQRAVVSVVAADSITITTDTAFALVVGNPIYKQTAAGTVPVGNTTKEVVGPTWSGAQSIPLLFEVNGTSACQINGAFISYE